MAHTTDRGDYTASFRYPAEDEGFVLTMTPKQLDTEHRSFYAEEDWRDSRRRSESSGCGFAEGASELTAQVFRITELRFVAGWRAIVTFLAYEWSRRINGPRACR